MAWCYPKWVVFQSVVGGQLGRRSVCHCITKLCSDITLYLWRGTCNKTQIASSLFWFYTKDKGDWEVRSQSLVQRLHLHSVQNLYQECNRRSSQLGFSICSSSTKLTSKSTAFLTLVLGLFIVSITLGNKQPAHKRPFCFKNKYMNFPWECSSGVFALGRGVHCRWRFHYSRVKLSQAPFGVMTSFSSEWQLTRAVHVLPLFLLPQIGQRKCFGREELN